jgi:hypothetical protein
MRSAAKNMCSVRHRPMPSAPNLRAVRASAAVSALVRTFSVRVASTQAISSSSSGRQRRRRQRRAPGEHLAGRAVDGQHVAGAEPRSGAPPLPSTVTWPRAGLDAGRWRR